MYRPVQPRKTYLPPRLAEEKENYRSVPQWENNICRPVPPRKTTFTVPSHRGKKYVRPVPKAIFTVPSRRGKKYLPSRLVMKIFPVEFYRPVPLRNYPPAVPSRPAPPTLYVLILPSRPVAIFSPAKQGKYVPSRPATILSHCDKP